jgi:peptidoglycan/xylan/chitin deacetylase (PgdA/CDA1 family)
MFIKSHPAVEEVGHYETRRYPNGGCSKEWVVDTPAVEAYDEYEEIQVYVPYTQEQKDEKRASEIRGRLLQLSDDFVQSWAGAYFPDLEERKKEFANLHNELRAILGKTPRTYF